MTAPYEKAKLAGYGVEFVEPPQTSSASGWDAFDPDGEQIASPEKAGLWPTEAAAWEACDNHRMYGSVEPSAADKVAAVGKRSKVPVEPPETRRVIVLSTAHLSLETCARLSDPTQKFPVYGALLPDGFYVHASVNDDAPDAPADLLAAMAHAHGLGFDYIQFDCDGPTVEGLEVFDHEPPRSDAYSYEGRGDFIAIVRGSDDVEVARVMWFDGELLEVTQARAAALCLALNAPVNVQRYMDALDEMEIPPNGDDCNNLHALALGGDYAPPHKGGR